MGWWNDKKLGEEKEQLLIKIHGGMKSSRDSSKWYKDVTFALIYSIFIAVNSSFIYGFASGYSSPVQSKIVNDLHLSTAEFSQFGSLLTLGGLIGALVSGKLADFIGRRGTMGLSSILSLGGWLSISFAQGSMLLDIGRLAIGIACGLITYVIPVYIAEITPKNLRGGLVLIHQLMTCCGITVVFLIGLVTTWRTLALIGIIPCMIQLTGLFFVPESPRNLVKNSSGEAYIVSLKRLRGKYTDVSQEASEIKEYTEAVENISVNLYNLFDMKYAYPLTVTLGLMALQGFGGTGGILFYATAIFESAGVSGTTGTIAMAFIQLPPIILGVFLLDKYGRRLLLLFSAAGMTTGCFMVALSYFLKAHDLMTDFSPHLALFGILTFAATFPVGMGGIPSIIMSEIFPINVKGAAGSLATVVACTSNWIVTYTFNFIMHWSSAGTFFVFMGFNVFSVLFIAKLVPETKGKTLEEIQELMAYR